MELALDTLVSDLERLIALEERDDLDASATVPTESAHFARHPASDAAIDALEQKLNVQLPEDYRAFLRIRDGWDGFDYGYRLLSTSEMLSPDVQAVVREIRDVWRSDPRVQHGVIVYLGDGRRFGFFDYQAKRSDAPPRLVFYDLGEDAAYATFTDFLLRRKQEIVDTLRDHGVRVP